jgi:plasmid stabilization system protein ParE
MSPMPTRNVVLTKHQEKIIETLVGYFILYRALEGRVIEIGRILRDKMDLQRHLPDPTDERGG